ncbi:hypothetical protein M427DRAFT_55703 [Gonapodya prolifera JEL478]|uniref:Microbial-type PARG catalytic domain-containing protein n=1 Tax=Gonapodya prolifera (strain JEL478) TaxID=1344416 RepID=A0A139AIA7_GONPJ|nr:hypothetical protein M427DRAFT_55703 [Gonapodya prolifera JEL478]|eukprot:KXS16274.1 hypothetical protein M427DRAFT_55703 [Gonapodya prolifera JEL478]
MHSLSSSTRTQFASLLEEYPNLIENIRRTKLYASTSPLTPLKPDQRLPPVRVEVINGDTLDVTREVMFGPKTVGDVGESAAAAGGQPRLRPLVLNMANPDNPGGGWLHGARAQEEQIFYRSTYDLSLSNHLNMDPNRTWSYPIPPKGAICSPGVLVFRANSYEKYRLLPTSERFFADFVAAAAIIFPRTVRPQGSLYHQLNESDTALTKDKIRTILRVSLDNGNDSLVLGAFGCGAFLNPPEHMASLFHQVFLEEEFKGRWKRVVFAVMDPKGEGNCDVFHEELQGVEI